MQTPTQTRPLVLAVLPLVFVGSMLLQADSTDPVPAGKLPARTASGLKSAIVVPDEPPERAAEARIARALSKRVSVDWQNKPLKDALREIGQLGGFPVVVDWQALKDAGVLADVSVALNLKQIALAGALHFTLEPFGLAALPQDEVLRITTVERSGEILTTRVYDIKRLVDLSQRWAKDFDARAVRLGAEHPFDLRFPHDPFGPPGAGFFGVQAPPCGGLGLGAHGCVGPNPFASPAPLIRVEEPHSKSNIVKGIVDAIRGATSGPWFDTEGIGGSLHIHGSATLTVRQTHRGHIEVRQFLQALEQVVSGHAPHGSVRVYPTAGYPAADDEAVRKQLRQRVSMRFEKKTLKEALGELLDKRGVQYLIDEQSLADAGVKLDQPVSLALTDITLRSALIHVMGPFGLTNRSRYGVLFITTVEKAEENQFPVVYDVSDLAVATRNGMDNLSEMIKDETSGGFFGEIAGIIRRPVPGVFMIRHHDAMHAEVAQLLANLHRSRRRQKVNGQQVGKPVTLDAVETRVYLIPDRKLRSDALAALPKLIDPPSWRKPGRGKVTELGNTLIIRQTVRNHLRIVILLKLPLEAAQKPLPPQTPEKQSGKNEESQPATKVNLNSGDVIYTR